MAIQLNHTIVHARDPQASARALTALLGRAEPFRFGPFFCVELDNGVTLDFLAQEEVVRGHLARRGRAVWPLRLRFPPFMGRVQGGGGLRTQDGEC